LAGQLHLIVRFALPEIYYSKRELPVVPAADIIENAKKHEGKEYTSS